MYTYVINFGPRCTFGGCWSDEIAHIFVVERRLNEMESGGDFRDKTIVYYKLLFYFLQLNL